MIPEDVVCFTFSMLSRHPLLAPQSRSSADTFTGPYSMDQQLKATLAKHNARATFFINTNNWRCSYDNDMIQVRMLLRHQNHSC